MMDGPIRIADPALDQAITDYCHALHFGDGAAVDTLCHDRFLMQWVGQDGGARCIDKAAFVARIGGRDAFPGEPRFDVHSVDLSGPDMAQVKLDVTVPPRVYTDQLGFLRVDGAWRLMTKLFRVADGPALED
ncbi:nuclear transport factor 2 family protein [Pseudooceanicola onchidii]|uniref:nuclear transport factor 2 family protein n=1 Tax=Pseudooceanicola onchidii TaxID=2562279 RepID=UPI0010AAB1B0|nr:nuclear transport factor 2 family protein [Pseudooceanicola onchidii]